MLQFKHISTVWQAIFKAIGTASRVQTESQYIACVQCMIQLALQASSCLAPSGGPLSRTPAGQAGPRDPEDPKELSLGRGTPSRGPPRLSRPHHALLSTGDPSRGPRRPQGPPGPSPSARGTPADPPLHWRRLVDAPWELQLHSHLLIRKLVSRALHSDTSSAAGDPPRGPPPTSPAPGPPRTPGTLSLSPGTALADPPGSHSH